MENKFNTIIVLLKTKIDYVYQILKSLKKKAHAHFSEIANQQSSYI